MVDAQGLGGRGVRGGSRQCPTKGDVYLVSRLLIGRRGEVAADPGGRAPV